MQLVCGFSYASDAPEGVNKRQGREMLSWSSHLRVYPVASTLCMYLIYLYILGPAHGYRCVYDIRAC